MKKTMITFFISIIIVCTVIVPCAYAYESDATDIKLSVPITTNDLFVSQEEAYYIALLFIKDSIHTGLTVWDENTTIKNSVIMYDETGNDSITAYTFELTSGYVVVSAYLGVENIVLEWSDESEPIYYELDVASNEKVVYVGGLGYYKDNGNQMLMNTSGQLLERKDVVNLVNSARLIENVPTDVAEIIAEEKMNSNISVSSVGNELIDDPYVHANKYYTGPFEYHDHVNKWENYVEFNTMDEFENVGNGYVNHCGPTAITNMIIMYGNRYNNRSITSKLPTTIFANVANIGTVNMYYANADFEVIDGVVIGGTADSLADNYLVTCFEDYGVNITVSNKKKAISYNNVKTSLSNNALLYVMLNGNARYGNHHVASYAYTRMQSTKTGAYKTYLKIVDGWASHGRYLDLAVVQNDYYWDVRF